VSLALLVTRAVIGVVTGVVALGLVVAGCRDLRRRNLHDAAWFGIAALLFGMASLVSTLPPSLLGRWF
jgi:hypothetical protein